MKTPMRCGVLCILVSILCSLSNASYSLIHLIKCLCMVYGITLITYALLHRRIHKANAVLYYLGIVLLTLYTWIAIDTYVVHTLTFIPGIVRYALFSMYGVWYSIFILTGLLLCYRRKES